MKRIIILSLAILSSFFSLAQTNIPQLVSFSAVVRDANNQLLVNTPVSIRLSFKQGGANGPLVYCALHQDSTNANGFISIQLNREVLGTGCNGAPSTSFENIPWHNGDFWMEVEYQTLASSPFVNLGQLELASSFYAFAAGTAERITNFDLTGIQNGDIMVYNSTTQMFEPAQSGIASVEWANIQNKPTIDTSFTNELQTLSISNDTIYLSNGGFVKLPASLTGAMLAPTTTNQAASNLQSFSATLNGTVNANGLSSTVVFEWGLTTAYGSIATATQSPVTGTTDVAVTADLINLQSNTSYHYRIKATNAVNVTYSNDLSFTTSLSSVPFVTNPITGRMWMDRNLGAMQVATSSTDAAAYGDLYQWGRGTDGHQIRTSDTTTTLSTTNTPGNSFILAPSSPYDWRSPQNDNLWQGVAGVNNPCPSGYRIPTADEWNTERASWISNNAAGAFASPLKLPVAGGRVHNNGSLDDVGSVGYYWSSTVVGTNSQYLYFSSSYASMDSGSRASGLSVRCIKD